MKINRFWFLLLSLIFGWTACQPTDPKQADSPEQVITDDIANQDSDLIESPQEIQHSDASIKDTLELNFEDLLVSFEGMKANNSFKNQKTILADTIEILLNKGQYLEDQTFKCFGEKWRNITVEQRVVANIVVHNKDKQIVLRDWKKYKSEWEPVSRLSRGIYKVAPFPENIRLEFPSVKEKELYKYLNTNLQRRDWAKLIREPEYEYGEKHWGIGISEVQIRLTGFLRQKIIQKKHLHFLMQIEM